MLFAPSTTFRYLSCILWCRMLKTTTRPFYAFNIDATGKYMFSKRLPDHFKRLPDHFQVCSPELRDCVNRKTELITPRPPKVPPKLNTQKKNIFFQWFSLIFNDFHWFWLIFSNFSDFNGFCVYVYIIFYGFDWFSMIFEWFP